MDPFGLSAVALVGGWISADGLTPDPSDAAWPKWVGYGIALGGAYVVDGIFFNEESELAADAPGCPSENGGFNPPKNWDGKKKRSPAGRGFGFPDKNGNIWVPTGPNGHGGPHWDVQKPNGGYINIYPGGKSRGGK